MTQDQPGPSLDWDAIFTGRILPGQGVRRGGLEQPHFVLVCGQPGSGKSTLIDPLCESLGPDQTQRISGDTLRDDLPEVYANPDDPVARELADIYVRNIQQTYVDALMDHAMALRAHVVWERPMPAQTLVLAAAARALGYRVECRILAVPLLESWLATLQRETQPVPDQIPRRIPWTRQQDSYARWPACLARAEDTLAFDALSVIGRDGQVYFENHLIHDDGPPRWANPAFGFESLMVERLQARSPARIDRLLSDWQALPADVLATASAQDWSGHAALGAALQALRDDPSAAFDLNTPGASPSPDAALAWVARLRADLAAVLTNPEAEGLKTLAPRSERLLALVAQIAGQPTR